MEKKLVERLRRAERELNDAKFIVGTSYGDCMMYCNLKRMIDGLWEMIDGLEG